MSRRKPAREPKVETYRIGRMVDGVEEYVCEVDAASLEEALSIATSTQPELKTYDLTVTTSEFGGDL